MVSVDGVKVLSNERPSVSGGSQRRTRRQSGMYAYVISMRSPAVFTMSGSMPRGETAVNLRLRRDWVIRCRDAPGDYGFLVVPVLAALAFVLLSAPIGAVGNLQACSCPDTPIAQRVESADAVLIGTPVRLASVVATPAGDQPIWDLEVERVYRGPMTPVISIGTGGRNSTCSVDLELGSRVGVVANWQSGHLVAGVCGILSADELLPLGEGQIVPGTSGVGAVVAGSGLLLALVLALALRRTRSVATNRVAQ